MSHPNLLDSTRAALVVVDVQEGFRNAMPEFEKIAKRIAIAVEGCQILNVPVLVTEQYPRGLGKTVDEVTSIFRGDFQAIEKTAFSSCGGEGFVERLNERGVEQVLLCGLETHVCVNQTAHDLLDRGYQVHLLMDCVCSRFKRHKKAGLAKMKLAGVIPSSVEMALFEMMRDAKHEQFKQIQALIK